MFSSCYSSVTYYSYIGHTHVVDVTAQIGLECTNIHSNGLAMIHFLLQAILGQPTPMFRNMPLNIFGC